MDRPRSWWLSTAGLALSLWLGLFPHPPLPLGAQTSDRWLFTPYGHPGRLDREPHLRSPNGRTEFHFSYEGRPGRSIRRFSLGVADDYPLASGPHEEMEEGRPQPSEINRLLEVFQKAAIEAELTPPPPVSPSPVLSSPAAPLPPPESVPFASPTAEASAPTDASGSPPLASPPGEILLPPASSPEASAEPAL